MDVEILSRIQFALTAAFHFIYPPISIGLGLLLVIMEAMYLKTGKKLYHDMTRFWVGIFALVFGMGVATGIVMEFEFGTNWSTYSRFVGDIFGSALAAEGIFAFFLESGFLAVLVFGWNRVSKRMHFFSTCMVSLGSLFSAVWIIVANSWQQTPAGYHIVQNGAFRRAVIDDFWAVVFNPSTVDRLSHTVLGALITGSFFVISVSAFYLVKQRHEEFAKASLRIGLSMAVVTCICQLAVGHMSATGVAIHQPVKMAAIEGHFDSSKPMDLSLVGWVDEANKKVVGISLPGMASWLIAQDAKHPLEGLDVTKKADRPPIQPVFQAYHIMVAVGFAMIGIVLVTAILVRRNTLWKNAKWLWLLVFAVVLPHIANQTGWLTAELGRQPWAVYDELRTSESISKVVTAGQVWASLTMFTLLYALLFVLFIYLLDRKIKSGPEGLDDDTGLGHGPAMFQQESAK
jgi:cytochrome d ubiquinol oxidase subunit I